MVLSIPTVWEIPSTHRLIPAKFSESGSVLEELGLTPEVLADLSEIDAATNERKLAELGANPGIGRSELLMGVPEAKIINAAFCHPGPHGGRFNNTRRGAWYAGLKLETSVAEVAYHKRRFLRNMRFRGEDSFEYQDFAADFVGRFHELDNQQRKSCMQEEPVPECYAAGQALAGVLLSGGSPGILYPSARLPNSMCIVCFRPALVSNPRRGGRYGLKISTETNEVGKGVRQTSAIEPL